MYLKEIRAQGFKSFADKMTFTLGKGITGIVGPNGSGKSNVVDAVRWVLGEQSVKALRGDGSMTDVIFSGSSSRNPLNVASVTLVFDNTDNYLPISFNEVSVRRRVYRDGTNEYYLNEEKVRLKDVQDLFLDSGIGRDSFNIISQGKIEEILSNKPTDRRVVFEEAAGVLKYKKRKEEAIKKLDKTHDNMSRVDDIIKELENQVEPLKNEKEKTLKYNEVNDELRGIEVALITNDITTINFEYQDKKQKVEALKKDILSLSTTNTNNEAIIENYKLKISNYEADIKKTSQELIDITQKAEQVNSQKNIILERQKYKVEDSKLHQNIINLKEEVLTLNNDINTINLELTDLNSKYNTILVKIKDETNKNNTIKDTKNKEDNNLSVLVRKESVLKNDISSLTSSIENNSSVPFAVRSVLDNPKLTGIHDVIGNLVDVPSKYSLALSVALGASSSFVVVDNEINAKEAINYLKNNNTGRATFFPLNIIKPKGIPEDISNTLKMCKGYISSASSLVKYDPKYRNIILNQLGNIIVVDNLDNANEIAKKINHSYRIVTLEGELLNVGGSLTGGKNKSRNIIEDKYELELKTKELENIENDIKTAEEVINKLSDDIRSGEDEIYLIDKERIETNEYIRTKTDYLTSIKDKAKKLTSEIDGTTNIINNSLSSEEDKIINEYYETIRDKDVISHKYDKLNQEKATLSETLSNFEFSLKKESSLYNTKNEELKNLEIDTNRMDVKLDNLLNNLSENYSMTYEKASTMYHLDIDATEARNKVNSLKKIIRDIGPINPNAPKEYDSVSTRYEFLIKQRDDLVNAENILLEIITEMDSVMEREFMKTFKVIQEKFSETFKELFKGGHAELKLTDKDNILETGIEIEACPPGKTLKSISLLSGGEKTFTAISLLFAVLKSRTMPFCILDEVEAALDEANVAGFGEYITKLKNQTQFILITHKKKTMEYADVLYGITMQESGVSKLVSVRLEDLKKEG